MTVWVTSASTSPACAHRPWARLTSSSTRLRPPEACDRAEDRARISPARSARAPRMYCAPTSRPSTKPASGLISYSSADLPGRPMRWPASRIRPACSTVARARDTVGLDSPDSLARSAREQGPWSLMCPSRSCSLSARMSWGRAAAIAPGMPADMTVTATSGVNPALTTTVRTSGRAGRLSWLWQRRRKSVVAATTSTNVIRLGRLPRAPGPGGPQRRAVANLLHRGLVAT